MSVEVEEVERQSSQRWSQLDDDIKEQLLEEAKSEANTIYSHRVSTLPNIVGDKDIFIRKLAAHKWELAVGGESNSQSQGGGSVNYNNPQGDAELNLTMTRYGREAYRMLRENQGIGVVRFR